MSTGSSDLFLRACELAEPPRLIASPLGVTNATARPLALQFPGPFAVLGSDPTADLVVDGPGISPRHYYLQAIGPHVLAVDLTASSPGGGGHHPDPADLLDLGRGLRLGGHQLTVESHPRFDASPRADGPPPIVLEFRARNLNGRLSMKRSVALIGTAPGCAARLDCPNVAPFHCSLVRTRAGLWVVDLLGEIDSPAYQGVAINGRSVRFRRFDAGDVLQVGRFRVHRVEESVSGRKSAVVPGPVDAIESLRDEMEARIAREAARHQAEVAALRREVERLQSRARKDRKRRKNAGSPPGPNPRSETQLRSLGTALHPDKPVPASDHSSPRETFASPSPTAAARRLGFASPRARQPLLLEPSPAPPS